MPKGELFVRTNGIYYKYYQKSTGKTSYIPKNNLNLATELAVKQQLILEREILCDRRHALSIILDSTTDSEKKYLAYITNPKFKDLLSTNHISPAATIWQNEKYNSNPNFPEQLIYRCPSGKLVRSKSEVFIDMVLNKYNIPYRYECELVLSNQTIYPDFTLLNPTTNGLLYWEHFGLMDNSSYASNSFNKLRFYYDNGLIPGKNLIITFETRSNPFTFKNAEAAIAFMML